MAIEIQQIGNRAIEQVRKENKANGIPIVFSRNGIIYYELSDGKITTKKETGSGDLFFSTST